MTREIEDPEFVPGKWAEADRNNKEDDWLLLSAHHYTSRKHFDLHW